MAGFNYYARIRLNCLEKPRTGSQMRCIHVALLGVLFGAINYREPVGNISVLFEKQRAVPADAFLAVLLFSE